MSKVLNLGMGLLVGYFLYTMYKKDKAEQQVEVIQEAVNNEVITPIVDIPSNIQPARSSIYNPNPITVMPVNDPSLTPLETVIAVNRARIPRYGF